GRQPDEGPPARRRPARARVRLLPLHGAGRPPARRADHRPSHGAAVAFPDADRRLAAGPGPPPVPGEGRPDPRSPRGPRGCSLPAPEPLLARRTAHPARARAPPERTRPARRGARAGGRRPAPGGPARGSSVTSESLADLFSLHREPA